MKRIPAARTLVLAIAALLVTGVASGLPAGVEDPTSEEDGISLTGAHVELVGEESRDEAGYSVEGVGDVNQDGYDDLMVGSFKQDGKQGAAYLFHGPIEDEVSVDRADAVFHGERPGDEGGYRVAGVGDVNGDGVPDVGMTAPLSDAAGIFSGSVYVFHGPVEGEHEMDEADAIVRGEVLDYTGKSLEGVGDVNQDGYDDVLVGASYDDQGAFDAGAAYLLHGPLDSSMEIEQDADAKLVGQAREDLAGETVASAGDVNGDGVPDLLVGAWEKDGMRGHAYLVHGPVTGEVSLADADATFVGEDTRNEAGLGLAGAGDVNQDGYDDVVVGAPGNDNEGGDRAGAAYILFGPLDGEISLSNADVTIRGIQPGEEVGWDVDGGQDVTGDGVPDLLVSGYWNDVAGTNSGSVYLFHGPITEDATVAEAQARFNGVTAGDQAGYDVSIAGDVNGQGVADLFMSSPTADPGDREDAGSVYGIMSETLDSDQDGLIDLDELYVHGTDPADADTDGDLVDDGTEIACGSNPNDPTSVPTAAGPIASPIASPFDDAPILDGQAPLDERVTHTACAPQR